jgi:hypothetical protein
VEKVVKIKADVGSCSLAFQPVLQNLLGMVAEMLGARECLKRFESVTPFSRSGFNKKDLQRIIRQLQSHTEAVQEDINVWAPALNDTHSLLQKAGFEKEDVERLIANAKTAVAESSTSAAKEEMNGL